MVETPALSALEMVQRFAAGTLSPVTALESAVERLAQVEPRLNAVVLLDMETGRQMAEASAARWRDGKPLGPLDGVPVAVKDTNNVTGWPTRFGSHPTSTAPAPADTPGVARLREGGAVFFCKTATPEYGWKGITHGPLTGITCNPLEPGADAGRLQRWLGGAGGSRRGTPGHGRRWWRLHPHPGGLHRHLRAEADLWAGAQHAAFARLAGRLWRAVPHRRRQRRLPAAERGARLARCFRRAHARRGLSGFS
ncbi:hypothetical protein HMPREF9946_01906 [Acetobacteraceae bacterium AT-5844]|nr:hypothetical protein HMPREF9946_01906 [Acetobacteraceae bacterium AT-5844]